jgi:AbrB family looped-hinge helix DNA binding protein
MTMLTVSDKGQITVPAKARRELGIKPGDSVEVEVVDDTLVVRPVKSLRSLRGIFAGIAAQHPIGEWEKVRTETETSVAKEVADEDVG